MKIVLVVSLAVCGILAGCTSAERGKLSAIGGSQHVELLNCEGQIIRTWDSDGTVHNEENSDGLYFTDRSNGNLVRIAGTFVVTQNK